MTTIEKVQVKEYGFSALIEQNFEQQISHLQKHFPQTWQTIVAMAYGRLLHTAPLKNMFFHYSHSFLSETLKEVDINSKKCE